MRHIQTVKPERSTFADVDQITLGALATITGALAAPIQGCSGRTDLIRQSQGSLLPELTQPKSRGR
jgi:hypothetical protein